MKNFTLRFLFSLSFLFFYFQSHSQKSALYGLSPSGTGLYDNGAIWKINETRTAVEEDFTFYFPNMGWTGNRFLMEGSNGSIYGVTTSGGRGQGNIFKFDTTIATYINLHNATDNEFENIANPTGILLEASNGKFYGCSRGGGVNEAGSIFEYNDSTGEVKNLYEFDQSVGKFPQGSLVEHSNGNLYGLVTTDNDNRKSIIFEYNLASNVFSVKKRLANYYIETPSSFTLTKAGKLYGTGDRWDNTHVHKTLVGPVVFEYDASMDSLILHVDYSDSVSIPAGFKHLGQMVEDSTGMLYGFTYRNSTSIFKFNTTTNQIDTILTLPQTKFGSNIWDIVTKDHVLYGSTRSSGSISHHHQGVLFSVDLTNYMADSILELEQPISHLLAGSKNKIYTTAVIAGRNQLLAYDINSKSFAVLVDREAYKGYFKPMGELVHASNGKIYGLTRGGGANETGSIFEFDPQTRNGEQLESFDWIDSANSNIGIPYSPLVEGAPGKLFGTATVFNDTARVLVIYQYDYLQDSLKPSFSLVDSTGLRFNNSSYQANSMVKANNGKLYQFIGNSRTDSQCVYEFDPISHNFSVKACFGQYFSDPGKMLAASNGKIYFPTIREVNGNIGKLYEFDPITDSIRLLYSFPASISPSALMGTELVEIDSNRFMGFIERGGANGRGIFFEYDLVLDSLIEVFNFDSTLSGSPAYIKKLSDGTIVGYTEYNYQSQKSADFFEYNPKNRAYTAAFELELVQENLGFLLEIANDTLTGIDPVQEKEQFASLRPNPFKESLSIQLEKEGKIDINLFSINGQLLYQNLGLSGSQFTLDFDFPTGVYFLMLTQEGITETHKVVKLE